MHKALSFLFQNVLLRLNAAFAEWRKPTRSFVTEISIDTGNEITSSTVLAFADGCPLAFKRIYDFYAPGMYRVACRYLGSRLLAEDLVQEVFQNLLLKKAKFGEPEEVKMYLFTSAKNVAAKLRHKF